MHTFLLYTYRTLYTHIMDNSQHLTEIINKNIMLLSHIHKNKTVLMMLIKHGKIIKTIIEIIKLFEDSCVPAYN